MKYRKYDQDQTKFIHINMREMLGEDTEAVIINDIIESLDLSSIHDRYDELGRPAYNPKIMLKLLVYGYYMGYFGGRPIYNRYRNDLGIRYLCNDDIPNFRTINLFRVKFIEEISDVFSQVVMLCKRLDMIGFENLAIDGQKLKANANLFQNKNISGIKKEKKRIEEMLKKLLEKKIESNDEKETEKEQKKLERRKKKLEDAQQLLEEAEGEDFDELRYNLTDPDSRIMKDKRSVKNPDYNAQNAADDKYQVLTAVDVINSPTDDGQLFPMKEKSEENTRGIHKNILADSGYPDKGTFPQMEDEPLSEFYVPDKTMQSSKDDRFSKWNFDYNEKKDVYICPNGNELSLVRTGTDSKGYNYNIYQANNCECCKYTKQCRKGKKNSKPKGGRTISIYEEDEGIKRMRKKLRSEEGKEIYQRRMATVEPVHGDMQKNRGFIQFVLRGIKKVKVEYKFLAIAHNIRKIVRHRADALKKLFGKAPNTA